MGVGELEGAGWCVGGGDKCGELLSRLPAGSMERKCQSTTGSAPSHTQAKRPSQIPPNTHTHAHTTIYFDVKAAHEICGQNLKKL